MPRVDNEILFSQMNWRYACKKFDPTKIIREEDWNILIQSLRLSASSSGLQPWKFIVVQNPELRQKLQGLSHGQVPVTEASHFIVLTYKEKMDEAHIQKHIEQTTKIRNIDIATLDKYKDSMMRNLVKTTDFEKISCWAQRQVYIALGSFLTTAALMEIDTLPMEGLNPEAYNIALDLTNSGYKTIAAIACGYRSADDKYQHLKKVRFDINDVVIYK